MGYQPKPGILSSEHTTPIPLEEENKLFHIDDEEDGIHLILLILGLLGGILGTIIYIALTAK